MRARDGFTKHHFRLPNAGRRGRTCLGNASRSYALGISCMYVIRSECMLMLMYWPKLLLAANLLAIPATALAKSGLYVFYREFIGPTQSAYFILIPAVLSIASFVVVWMFQLLACSPVEAAWDLRFYTETSCHSRYYCGTVQASVEILTDLYLTCFLLFKAFPLQMHIRGKVRVVSYFLSSLLTLVPTALRLHISVSGHGNQNPDPTWDLFRMATYWLYNANCIIKSSTHVTDPPW